MGLSTSALLKGVAGLGVVSTASVGGVFLYKKDRVSYSSEDTKAFNTKGSWSLTSTPSNITNPPASTPIEVILQLTGGTWICKIKGTIKSPATGKNLNITTQLDNLKTAIGVNGENQTLNSKNSKFQQFFENCIRNRNGTEMIMDLGEMELGNDGYEFSKNFEKTYNEIFFSQQTKEKSLNISCTDSNCTITEEKKKELGFTQKSSGTITMTKNTQEDPKRFNDGISYTITGTTNKDGNYTITKDWFNNFKLIKVENLNLQELCKKVGLKYNSGTSPNCTMPTGASGWVTSFYKDNDNYAKDLKVSGITAITISQDTDSKYYEGQKFMFTGSATFADSKVGSIEVEANKGYTIKYVPKIKNYAFIKAESN